jgi:hypothetical protein
VLNYIKNRLTLFAVLAVPLQSPEVWHHMKYSQIPQNEVRFERDGVHVAVKESTSPLIHLFGDDILVKSVHVKGRILGFPTLENRKEGTFDADDYAVQVGFAETGPSRLNWIERLFAPQWLRDLTNLDSERPLGKVYFLNISQQKDVGEKNMNSRNKLVEEEVVKTMKKPDIFELDHTFDPPLKAFGVWLQSDGDDSQSAFEVAYNSLSLDIAAPTQ